jgi:dipeptidyl aminopeptidase/acylaminoacyl peptidase
MNSTDRLERDLTAWLGDTAAPRMPDYVDSLLARTAATRQRSAWTFLERWLPMSVLTLGRQTIKPLPWRTIGLLAVLTLLVAAAAVLVGSRPRVPPPFGLAANGLVAYTQAGDVYSVDPTSGTRRAIVTGPENDRNPRWSRDGTRLAFLRGHVTSDMTYDIPVIASANGTIQVVPDIQPLRMLDSDSVVWSSDGRTLLFAADFDAGRAIYLMDTTTGKVTTTTSNYLSLEFFPRPPDGGELLYLGGTQANQGLFLIALDDGSIRELPLPPGPGKTLRPIGWTPDGERFAFHRGDDDSAQTYLVDLASGAFVVIDAAFTRLSNDGTRIAGIVSDAGHRRVCVASTAGGACVLVGEESQTPDGNGESLQWSPDDKWIVTQPQPGRSVLIDPTGAPRDQPGWLFAGAQDWQRVAP